jgi:4-hydroxybenzoate polyprenyltransferase
VVRAPAGRIRRPGWLAVVHPFPSVLNAIVVLALALAAGGSPATAGVLALAMLGLQFSIGASNDLIDHDTDALSKPHKPIPSGRISRHAAILIALASGGGGMALASTQGAPVAAMAAAMLGAGMAYNAFLKRGHFAWVAYAVALPIVPVYAWWGAVEQLPPRPELLLPLAALAGPALQLANGLVDIERDRVAGTRSFALWLGRSRALTIMALLHAVIHGLAWLSLVVGSPRPALLPLLLLVVAGVAAAGGVMLSAASEEVGRERGWRAQAASVGVLALGWLIAANG